MNAYRKQNGRWYQRHPAFGLLIGLVVGIAAYQLGLRLSLFLVWALLFACLLLSILSLHRFRSEVSSLSLWLAICCCGWLVMYSDDPRNRSDWFGYYLHDNAPLIAVIERPVEEKAKTLKLYLSMQAQLKGEELHLRSGNALLYIFKNDTLQYALGDTLLLQLSWPEVPGRPNPFGFNYKRFLAIQHIYHLQYASADKVLLLGKASSTSLWVRMHEWCLDQLKRFMKNEDARAVMEAMLVGEESRLDEDLRTAYAETGIIHIIAISGGHIVFLFSIITFFFKRWQSKTGKVVQYLIGLFIIWVYVLIAGAPPSAVRAATMFSMLALSFFFGRKGHTLNSIFLTAFVLLSIQPTWLFNVGFQLSVLAVLSIVLFYPFIHRLWQPNTWWLRHLWKIVVMSIAVEILVGPLVVWYFHMFPLYFILSNIIAWILMTGAMILGTLLLLFSFWPWLAYSLGHTIEVLLKIVNESVTFLQSVQPEWITSLALDTSDLLLIYSVILLASIGVYFKRHISIQLGILLLAIGLLISSFTAYSRKDQERFVLYVSGQNIAAEHINGSKALSYYCGIDSNIFSRNILPTHIHWGVKEQKLQALHNNRITFNGKRIVLLSDLYYPAETTACDVLIMCVRPRSNTFDKVRINFTPKQIVLSGRVTKGYADMWLDSCMKYGIDFHDTRVHGAYVLYEQ